MEPTNTASKRTRQGHTFSKFTAKLRNFFYTLGRISEKNHRDYTRLPRTSLEAKSSDVIETRSKKLEESTHVATPRVRDCTCPRLTVPHYYCPFHCHPHRDFQHQNKELMLGDSRWGDSQVARSDAHFKSGNEMFSSEDEYVYEVNKWCRVKGFQTKFRSSKLD